MVEKELFWGQIFKMDILVDLHILWLTKWINLFFRGWSKCVFIITEKTKCNIQNIRNSKFGVTYVCFLKHFMKIGQNVCVQGDMQIFNTLWPLDRIFCQYILVYLVYTKYNINII